MRLRCLTGALRSGRKRNGRQSCKRSVTGSMIGVPGDVVHLGPFVRAHDDDVIPSGDVGDELVFGDDQAEPVDIGNRRLDDRQAFLEGRPHHRFLAERDRRDGEVDPVQSVMLTGDQGDLEVGDRGWVEGTRVHAQAGAEGWLKGGHENERCHARRRSSYWAP